MIKSETGILEIKEDTKSTKMQSVIDAELDRLFPLRLIKRVLFVVPPDAEKEMFNYATGKRRRYWNFPPYGVGIIASHLRTEGIIVDIINLNNEVLKKCFLSESEETFDFDETWKLSLEQRLKGFQPDFIGVTSMFTQTNNSTVAACNEIKEKLPKTPLALGGVHPTNCLMNIELTEIFINDFGNVDLFFLFEAELAVKQFIRAVNRNEKTDNLYQVIINSQPRRLYFSEKSVPVDDDLNIIASHDLMETAELSKYGTIGGFYCLKDKGAKLSTALFNRGCRGQCTYCSVRNFNGPGVRGRSVESVIDELAMLKKQFGVEHVMWLDDDFLKDKKRSLELCDELIKRDLGVTWDCTNGVIAASCTEDVISKAAMSGCLGLTVGMESGNPEILRIIRKPGSVEIFISAAKVLRKYEQINARVFLMIGFPGETYRQILDTINVAIKMELDWYNITILQPLPNTPLFETMVQQGLLKDYDFQQVRYNSGAYGKQRKKMEQKKDLLSGSFKDAFDHMDLDAVPSAQQLDDIWAYMNYHLNFKRLFSVKSPVKLMQQYKYVKIGKVGCLLWIGME